MLDAAAGGAEDSSPTELKLTYSAAANGGYEIKIALNGAYAAEKSVLVITQADIEDLKAQVNAIAELVDKFTAQGAGETVVAMAEAAGFEAAAAGEGDSSLTADLLKAIFGGDGILSVLNIFGEPVITIGQIEDAIVLNLLGIDFAVEENAIAFDGELRINGSTLLGFEDVSVGARPRRCPRLCRIFGKAPHRRQHPHRACARLYLQRLRQHRRRLVPRRQDIQHGA